MEIRSRGVGFGTRSEGIAAPRTEVGRENVVAPSWAEALATTQTQHGAEENDVQEIAFEIHEDELSLDWLISEAQARNPGLAAMVAAARAAAQAYPRAVALDDPMFMYMTAPASLGSSRVDSAYILRGSQKIPWFGKREARGREALAESNAACHEVAVARLRLIEITKLAFFDYYLARRELELNRENARVMGEFRDAADGKYRANLVTRQDVLQADVELADLERRRIELTRMDRVAIARINAVLRRPSETPLPAPEGALEGVLESAEEVASAADLREIALANRPDLSAQAARLRAAKAAVDLAERGYYPDFDVFGGYDSFWQPASTQSALRGQVGLNINLPIYRAKTQAAVREAQFRVAQRRAEYRQLAVDIEYETASAREQLSESVETLRLLRETYLPLATQNVAAAVADYDAGLASFSVLAQAQRQLITLRESEQEALANYHRRRAELERVIAGPLP